MYNKHALTLWLLATSALFGLGTNANANLIVNGDFESSDVSPNTWQWFTSNEVDGWQGSNLEIWNTFRGINAYSGSQFAELNAHGQRGQSFTIFQSVQTQIDSLYQISFSYRARRNENEAFEFSLNNGNSSFYSALIDDHTPQDWQSFQYSFVATSSITEVAFSSVFPKRGTRGNFLDDVVLLQLAQAQSTQVSGPASTGLILLGFSLIALFSYRRKQQHYSARNAVS
ncbi:response regulator receiver protein [Agaribacter flavus]|uniref:Response regulator receiver protein n=1 Tax=Agaribacter flavus TaxID=1902781 RepID=A0ABV7FJF1_9ALTE